MPRPYSEHLRWRAIWMKEILGFQVDEVAAALWMSPRTIERYVSKVLNSGDVKAGIIGRPANSAATASSSGASFFAWQRPARNE